MFNTICNNVIVNQTCITWICEQHNSHNIVNRPMHIFKIYSILISVIRIECICIECLCIKALFNNVALLAFIPSEISAYVNFIDLLTHYLIPTPV